MSARSRELAAQPMAEDGVDEVPDAVAVHSPPDVAWPGFMVAGLPNRAAVGGRPDALRCPGPVPHPVFITQATDDKTWDAEMARRLVARMHENGCHPERTSSTVKATSSALPREPGNGS